MKLVMLTLLLIGCSADHRTRILSAKGHDCARVWFKDGGAYPGWQVESDAGPANFPTLDDAIDFGKRACGAQDAAIGIEEHQ